MFEIMNQNVNRRRHIHGVTAEHLEDLLLNASGLVYTKKQNSDEGVPGDYNDPEKLDEDKNLDYED